MRTRQNNMLHLNVPRYIKGIGSKGKMQSTVTVRSRKGAAVVEWLSSWLAEQEGQGSIPGLAT